MIERYSRQEMSTIWSDESRYAVWLEVETLALEKLEQLKIVPEGSAAAVRQRAKIDVARINELEATTKHDVIAFVSQVAESVGAEGGYLHRGMTSSDLLDTSFAVLLRRAGLLIVEGIDRVLGVVKARALEHRDTICIGRTHGMHAEPVTVGLKFAGWYAELKRQRSRVMSALEEVRFGKISGAVGTYAALPPSVEEYVLSRLGLQSEIVSTQVVPRDRHAQFFLALAQVATSLERFCVEIRHLQRTEVREMEESFTKGQKGSSAMPHKRNPILSENLCGLARLVRSHTNAALENVALWHERDISHSSVERVIAPDATIVLDFMLHRFAGLVEGLMVNKERCLANLEMGHGLIFSGSLLTALVEKGMTRDDAYALVQTRALEAWEANGDFKAAIWKEKGIQKLLSKEEFDALFDTSRHVVHINAIIERALTV